MSSSKPPCGLCGEPYERHNAVAGGGNPTCPNVLGVYTEGPPPTLPEIALELADNLLDFVAQKFGTRRRPRR